MCNSAHGVYSRTGYVLLSNHGCLTIIILCIPTNTSLCFDRLDTKHPIRPVFQMLLGLVSQLGTNADPH